MHYLIKMLPILHKTLWLSIKLNYPNRSSCLLHLFARHKAPIMQLSRKDFLLIPSDFSFTLSSVYLHYKQHYQH